MRYIIVEYSNGYNGCDVQEYCLFKDDTPDSVIDSYCHKRLQEYAEDYEFAAKAWGSDFEDDEDRDSYYHNCSFYWTEVYDSDIEDNENFNEDEWTEID